MVPNVTLVAAPRVQTLEIRRGPLWLRALGKNEFMDEAREIHRFEHAGGWIVSISLTGRLVNGNVTAHADLYRDGKPICRIAAATRQSDEGEASAALKKRALIWINDWQSRQHGGDTAFQELHD